MKRASKITLFFCFLNSNWIFLKSAWAFAPARKYRVLLKLMTLPRQEEVKPAGARNSRSRNKSVDFGTHECVPHRACAAVGVHPTYQSALQIPIRQTPHLMNCRRRHSTPFTKQRTGPKTMGSGDSSRPHGFMQWFPTENRKSAPKRFWFPRTTHRQRVGYRRAGATAPRRFPHRRSP